MSWSEWGNADEEHTYLIGVGRERYCVYRLELTSSLVQYARRNSNKQGDIDGCSVKHAFPISTQHPHMDQSAPGKIKDSFCFWWLKARSFITGCSTQIDTCSTEAAVNRRREEQFFLHDRQSNWVQLPQKSLREFISVDSQNSIYLVLMWTYFPLWMRAGLNVHACGGRHTSTHVDSGQSQVSDFTPQITWDGTPAGFLLSTTHYLTCYVLGISLSLLPISL